jgi:hypothetical protein
VRIPIITGRRVDVRLLGSGRFWCLSCETDQDYQRREWRTTGTAFFLPVLGVSSGEFVLCETCESAFDVECLDESSTALHDELVLFPPAFAINAALSGAPQDGSPPPWVRPTLSDNLSGHSAARRH